MGLWLEVKEKVTCPDNKCLAQSILETVLEKIGLDAQNIEEHVKKLAELISGDIDGYIDDLDYTFEVKNLKISIYGMKFDVVECRLKEGCDGYIVASVEVESDASTMREIAKTIIKNMGIDKYVKICE